ncbi:MAG: PAS domain S-box protein [Proteobacteria bacterium]|nr:PAS domain S-box protein [Pseudomonadota bacterium]
MFKVRKLVTFYLLILLLIFIFCFPATAGISADPASLKEITVVSDDNYPPYIFRDENNHLQGILVDEWHLWEEKTGIRVDLRGMDWDKAQKTMAEGDAQVIDTIFFTEERAKKLAFTAPYASIDVPIFFHKDISGIKDVKSLRGFTIGVKAGDACIDFLKKNGISTLQEFPSYESIIRAAMEHKVKVFCIDAPPALYYLYKMNLEKEYRYSDPLYTGQFHRAVPKERKDLLSVVESGFAGISQKEHEQIRKRWLGAPLPMTRYLVYIFYLMVAFVLFGGILLLWNRTLRRNVTQKTIQLNETIDALQKSEEKYRLIAENTADLISVLDMNLHFTYISPASMRLRGYTVDEAMEQTLEQVLTPESMQLGLTVFEEEMQLETSGTADPDRTRILELEEYKKDGSIIWVEANFSFLRDKDRKPVGILIVSRDISERKKAEDVLRKSEEKYQILVENANETILVIQDGMVKFVNSKASESFGYTEQEFLSTPIFELIHPEDRDAVIERYLLKIHGDTTPTRHTYRIIHKIGEIQWIEISSVMIEWEGRPATLNLVMNITERVRAEEEKRNLEERLQRAEKMESLGILAGGVAHDLNNVLGIVVGYAEMLLMGADKSSPIRSKLVNIMEGGQKAAMIVGDLLTLARRGVSGRDVINLNKIIADWQQSSEFEKLSSYHSAVKIKTELEPDLLNISASSVHLGKTIFNLVSNASEAMPKGGVLTIKTANQYIDKPIQGYDKIREGDYVVLSVSDTGEGITTDDLKHIFEPFYTKKVMGRSGTGLGLSVVWGTVKDHNGYINVESEEGKGSTFTLYFPVTREELSAEHVAVLISEYMGKGESILIVDDVKGQRALAEEMLKKLNYNVTSASSGEEAVAYLKGHNADLMVLDMIMDPGMDGLDTYRQVLGLHPKQKAIIMSGFSESDRVKAAQALGAGAYVRKPYVIEKLGLAVRKELDKT